MPEWSTFRCARPGLDAQGGYPPEGSPAEYGFYAEACFPIADDRRQFFQQQLHGARPHTGYRLLVTLADSGFVDSVWTTNFDGLTARAAAGTGIIPIEVGLDSSTRVIRATRKVELLCVAIHGDYRYDALKNLPSELRDQEAALSANLIGKLETHHCIIIGYGGRDSSVVRMFIDAYSRPGPGRLYWCGYGEESLSDDVLALFAAAQANGRTAYYVATQGFDDTLIRASGQCLPPAMKPRAEEILASLPPSDTVRTPFVAPDGPVGALIKSNTFPIDCPSEVLEATVTGYDCAGAWQLLREDISGHDLVAGFARGKVLMFGTLDAARDAFGTRLTDGPRRVPIDDRELSYEDGKVVALLTEALTRSIASALKLEHSGKHRLWRPDSQRRERVYGVDCLVYAAATLHLRRHGRHMLLILNPTIEVTNAKGEPAHNDAVRELRRQFLTAFGNKDYNDSLKRWRELIFGEDESVTFAFPHNAGTSFRYRLSRRPAFAAIVAPRPKDALAIVEKHRKYITQHGTVYPEPRLLFSTTAGTGVVRDEHPIRGMADNRPYDFALTARHFEQRIRVGIVCPKSNQSELNQFLCRFHNRVVPDTKRDYLLEYPGFARAFGLPLELPEPGHPLWATCPEPPTSGSLGAAAQELRASIIQCVKALSASSPNLILIFLPDRWEPLAHETEEDENVTELHDAVKAYCVQQGRCTQFLWESTIRKRYSCEIVWWLALSLYTKSMRIPWVIDGLDEDTAYVGLGFSIDRSARPGEHVLMGCSHLYNARGYGLRYRLTRLEDSIIRHKNPFLSRADARRAGENIRQLFFESAWRMPARVVIHKRTPFNKDERLGLLEGLQGVDRVDLLEINLEPFLRYVAANYSPRGEFEDSKLPVKRGTPVVLSDSEALLWVHGTADGVNSQKYFKGRRTVPAPLRVRRHWGNSDLATLATEILGLSKMDWNSFDLYTQLPATIRSSNEIARIGLLLERLGPMAYDYRLFM